MTRTNEQKFKSLASRLRFIQRVVWDESRDTNRDEINQQLQTVISLIEQYYGKKIAREMFWAAKDK